MIGQDKHPTIKRRPLKVSYFFTLKNSKLGNGNFEFYDLKTGGNEWYAEGSLYFEDKELIDFDGCFDIPNPMKDKLIELGYSVDF